MHSFINGGLWLNGLWKKKMLNFRSCLNKGVEARGKAGKVLVLILGLKQQKILQ